MDQVRVTVSAADPVTAMGITCYLRTRREIGLIPQGRIAEAQIVVLVVDSMTPDLMAQLRQTAETTPARIILVTDQLTEHDLLPAIECRVAGVLPRSSLGCERLVAAVLAATRGAADLPPDLVGTLLAQMERIQREVLRPRGLTASGLADREVDMLKLMAEGWDTGEIAQKLSYSERTVKSMVHGVLQRFQLRNRTHAVAYAMRAGVI